VSEDKRRTKSDELDIDSVMRPLRVLTAEMDGLVCKGEDAGIADCLARAAHLECHLRESPNRCPKNSQAARETAARVDAEADRDRRRVALELRGIPKRTLRLVEAASPLKSTQSIAEVGAFLADRDLRILVLGGDPGCGKTFAAVWAIIAEGRDGRFIDVAQLARIDKYDEEIMRPLERESLLVIDDLGSEYADKKGAFLSTLDGLINARYANDVRTIITTNLTAETFSARYDERIVRRVRECGRFLSLRKGGAQ
jgi:DNA replication protein DnaC